MKKDASERTEEDALVIRESPDIVAKIESRARKRAKIIENKTEVWSTVCLFGLFLNKKLQTCLVTWVSKPLKFLEM